MHRYSDLKLKYYSTHKCHFFFICTDVAVTDLFCLMNQCPPPPGDSATHWPISGQSTLILSSSKELFFLALFRSPPQTESTRQAEKKTLSCCLPRDIPTLMIFTEDNCCYLWHPKELFSLRHSLLSVIKINLSLLFFKEALLFCSVLHK